MKKSFFLLLFALFQIGLMAQDPVKDIKKAGRTLATYNLDPTLNASKLKEAVDLANASIGDPLVQADPASWQIYGDIFMTVTNQDVQAFVLDQNAKISDPTAPGKAFKGFLMAEQKAEKSYQKKDALTGLANGIQNVYFMGSALYQAGHLKEAYEAFKAAYEGFNVLQKNNEPTKFDASEHAKALYYAGLCAQDAGMIPEAVGAFDQLIKDGKADAGTYEALYNINKETNPAAAEKYLMEGRTKYPDDVALLYAEINHLLAKGELTSLVSKLEEALAKEPNNISVMVTLGQIYDKLYQDMAATDPVAAEENFNKAMNYYQQAATKDPKSFDAVYSIGALWYNKAAAYSVELNALSNDYSPAGTKKYEAIQKQMDETFAKALPYFLQAEGLNPNDVNTLIALKEIYARQDKLDLVESYKQKIEALNNN